MQERGKVLEDLGLSKNETIVYLTLLDLGSATATKIADKSKLHRTTVYDVLDRLVEKGMASYITKQDTKYFQAADPDILIELLNQKREKLIEMLPELKLGKKLAESKDKAYIFEGIIGVRNSLQKSLDLIPTGDDLLIFGVPEKAHKIIGNGFLSMFHKKRIAKKITMWHIYNEDAKERMQYLESLPYTKVAFLPKEYNSPVATRVCADIVCFDIWSDQPVSIMIESKRMAQAYKKYFELLWGLVKK